MVASENTSMNVIDTDGNTAQHFHSHTLLPDIQHFRSALQFLSFPTAGAIKSHHTGTVANKSNLFGHRYTNTRTHLNKLLASKMCSCVTISI